MKNVFLLFILAISIMLLQPYDQELFSKTKSHEKVFIDAGNTGNLPEEDQYFEAYFLPLSRADELQEALDTYGSVRLEKGTYQGAEITLKTGQRLFGHPRITKFNNNIHIQAGSTDVSIHNIDSKDLVFEPGAPIKNNLFKSLQFTNLNCTNCSIEDNTFVNMDKCMVSFDCSLSGYFRNNKFIKLWSHSTSPQTVMKGNSRTPSYGNVILWRNYLIPRGNATHFSNLESLTIVGMDAESWNFQNRGSKPLLYMRGMGSLNLGSFSGVNFSKNRTPVFDIEAQSLFMLGKNIYSKSTDDIVRKGTNMVMLSGQHENYEFEYNDSTFNLKAFFNDNEVYLDDKKVQSKLAKDTSNKVEQILIKKNVIPWARPQFHNLPEPVDANMRASRYSKPDQSSEIQKLIDRHGIAELEEGIYYISKPVFIKNGQGIIGKGSGKTAIVGTSDDFPLIVGNDDVSEKRKTSSKYYLAHLTLFGGEKGLYVNPRGKKNNHFQLSSCTFKNLIFRNQKNGIHFDKFYGVDNNFFDNVSFVDCEIGMYQEPTPGFDVNKGETSTMMYMDKNVFYNCQIIRCTIGFSMVSLRPNNLNAWIDCRFDQNNLSVNMQRQINPIFANCDFENNVGEYIVGKERSSSFYNCRFINNATKSVFRLGHAYIEGCQFLDRVPLFSGFPSKGFVLNSMVKGSLGSMNTGLLVNNKIDLDTSLNLRMVELKKDRRITIIDGKSDPTPQFLVTQP
ncbi:hypothetical protein [Pareuzebyella sediminis]|uniref:hypothetical protein n=1 Tax=Pareuzebyella sediminis TaxID=2607998 RepID=UPI0011F012E6|nr:hypothetical protein [Pareuzebyella sediminis]